jgi:tetratricopeptide (TPR) repeat protein
MISWRNWRGMSAATLFLGTLVVPSLAAQSGSSNAKSRPDSIWDAIFVDAPDRSGGSTASGTVPVELLRHPLDQKTRRMLRKALDMIDRGSHEAAIGRLQEILAKNPDAGYYSYSLLGFAYLKTDRYALAVDSFEKALTVVPDDAVNHYNLGLSLVSAGNYDRGRKEVRHALDLDPSIAPAKALLESLASAKHP